VAELFGKRHSGLSKALGAVISALQAVIGMRSAVADR
jgi:hypothetical protein